MKKTAIIITFILISVISTGSFFMHQVLLSSYKSDIRTYIQNNKKSGNYSVISINPSELYVNTKAISWEDGNQEIIYKGNLYDIVSISITKGKVNLTILSDQQEETIKQLYASNYTDSAASSGNPIKLLKQFLALKFLTDTSVKFHVFNTSFTDIHFTYRQHISSVFLSQENPPPVSFS